MPTRPIAIAGGNQIADIGVQHVLDGTASYDPEGFPIDSYSWFLLYKPPGSGTVLVDDNTAHAKLTPDKVGTYRIFLVVTAGGRSSQIDPLLADQEAFANVSVPTTNHDWIIPARQQVDWDGFLYTILTDLDAIPDDIVTVGDDITVLTNTGAAGESLTSDGVGGWLFADVGAAGVVITMNCDVAVQVGDAVYVSSSNTASQAQADNSNTAYAIGVVTAKSAPTVCEVTLAGRAEAAAYVLTPGTRYYLSESTPGALTSTIPTGSGEYIALVGTAITANALVLQVESPVRIP